MSQINVLEFFSGAGGMSLGFKSAGARIVGAFDNDQVCIQTYNKNLGPEGYVADVSVLNKKTISKIIGTNEKVDVITGGPPCQGFSVQRRGEDKDSRNNLVLEYIRLVLEYKPKFFVMENVGGLLSTRGKPFLEELKRKAEQAGYQLHIKKLNAADYGVPQLRKRVFIVGEKTRNKLSHFSFPQPTIVNSNKYITVRSAISDLKNLGENDVANHKADRLSEINLKRIRSLKPGQGRDSLPPELMLDCHKNNSNHRHLDTYGRMEWDKPASTITARFDSFSRGRFGHPVKDRTITLREGARLQTFPDDFMFLGSKIEVARQIGNAVPPLLAKAIADSIIKVISDKG
jgi:DNA (cytosine-5)-methyltransferase 1